MKSTRTDIPARYWPVGSNSIRHSSVASAWSITTDPAGTGRRNRPFFGNLNRAVAFPDASVTYIGKFGQRSVFVLVTSPGRFTTH